jgi:hypothetical protein
MKTWWGTFDLSKKGILQKQIGPLWLAIKQNTYEWQIYYEKITAWQDDAEGSAVSPESFVLGDETLKERYVLNNNAQKVVLMPALADRAVVARPVTPFYVPVGQTATIFISTPLWVTVALGEEKELLTEIPILRPPDTWFGPDTLTGELCYASRTSGRMAISELPKRSYRATTPVQIRNDSDSHLLLERINLPVPYLEIYEAADHHLWTQAVKMVRKEDAETATLEILDGPPTQIQGAKLLSDAREQMQGKTIIRTISGFFA